MKTIIHILLVFSLSTLAYSQNNIIAAEYYIGSDPGEGKGTSLIANDGSFDSTSEDISLSLSTSSLSFGRHYIFIRYKDTDNGWGESKAVALDIANPKGLDDYVMATEYFTDTDPGLGNGMSINASDGSFDSAEENFSGSINTTNLTHGVHKLFVRAKGSRGGWGEASSVTLQINDTVAPTISSVSMASDNSTVAVSFSEVVYNTANGSGDLELSDFKFLISSGRAELSSETPTSISIKDGIYTLGVGLIGIPEATQKITVNPVDDSIYDIVGNEISQTQTNNNATFFGPNKYVINFDGTGDYTAIQSAIDNSNTKHGDTLLVYPGLYEESVDYKKKNIVLGSLYVTTNDTTYRDKTVIQGTVTMDTLNNNAQLLGITIYKSGLIINAGSPKIDFLNIRESTIGAIYIDKNADVKLNHLKINSNTKNDHGAGLYIRDSKVELHDSRVDSNSAPAYGGGIYSITSNLKVFNSNFNYNKSESGGAIFSTIDTSLILENLSIKNNEANKNGGGISINRLIEKSTIKNLTVSNNSIESQYGGGMFVYNSSVDISQSTFENNTTNDYGGGLHFESDANQVTIADTLLIQNTFFTENTFRDTSINDLLGGGLSIRLNGHGSATIKNVVFNKNYGIYGSALYTYRGNSSNSDIKVVNSTFAKNRGGVTIHSTGNGALYLANSIIWHNTSFTSDYLNLVNVRDSVLNNNIEAGFSSALAKRNINSDPNFIDLANDDYHLSDSSPSIGTGTSISAPSTDIEGNLRPNPAGSNPDMGAYESSRSTRVTDTYYVMKSGDDQNNGSTSSPFLTIQRGVDAAYDGDTVIVYPGLYSEGVNYKQKNILLGSRYLTTNDSTYRDKTVIQGTVTMDSLDASAGLIGFMVYNGNLNIDSGRPILKLLEIREANTGLRPLTIINNANLIIEDIMVRSNDWMDTGSSADGAIYIRESKVVFNNALIDSNQLGIGEGGGLNSGNSHITINNSKISNNIQASKGGGIFSTKDSSYVLNNVVIKNNKSNGNGGGIYFYELINGSLNNCLFENNTAGAGGGGIYAYEGNFSIKNSSVINNRAEEFSGGGLEYFSIQGWRDTLIMENVSFMENYAKINGGGVNIEVRDNNKVFDFKNILISNNTNDGSGAFHYEAGHSSNNLRLVNATLANNVSNNNAASTIVIYTNGIKTIMNSIVWFNSNSQAINDANIYYSNAPGLTSANGNMSIDPLFVNADLGDYSLQSTSPSIDAGNPDLDGDGVTWENDTDDQDPDGTRMDMGFAWFSQLESEPPTIEITSINNTSKFGSGETKAITWTATDNFRIDWTKLFLKAPDSTSFVIMDSLFSNPGTYDYEVPQKVSKDYYLMILVADPSGNTAADTQRFEVIDATLPILALAKPSTTLEILEYDTLDIEWSVTDNHLLDSTWIYYSIDSLLHLTAIDSFQANAVTYRYKIPMGVTKEAIIKIVSSDSTGNTGFVESALFEVIDNTKPVIAWNTLENKILKIGTSRDLNWTSSDNVGVDKVDLAYSKDQSNWIDVAKQVANQNTYNWQIANDPSQVELRVIGFDAVGLSDTSVMSGYTIKESYPQITSNDIENTVDWKRQEVKLVFDQKLDPSSISTSNFVLDSQQNDNQIPSFTYDENSNTITLRFENGFISKDSLNVLVKGDIKSFYGYAFDGNADEAPGGTYTFSFKASLLGDYNNDSNIDGSDLAVLLSALQNNEIVNELGPVEGDTAPYFKTISDGNLDIEDVMAFVRLWNWKKENPNSSVNDWNNMGEVADISFSHNSISFTPPNDAFIYEIEIQFISGEFEGGSSALPSALLKYYEESSSTIYLTSEVDQDEINIPIKFSDRYGTVQVNYRLLNQAGQPVSQGKVIETIENIPNAFALHENYPNPFNPITTINYDLPKDAYVNLIIYDVLGREVVKLVSEELPGGYQSVQWNTRNNFGKPVSAGIYFYQLQTKDFVKTRKMLLLK